MWSLARASRTPIAATTPISAARIAATAMNERLRTSEGSPPEHTGIDVEHESAARLRSSGPLTDKIRVDRGEHRAPRAMRLLVHAQLLQRGGLERRDQLDQLADV